MQKDFTNFPEIVGNPTKNASFTSYLELSMRPLYSEYETSFFFARNLYLSKSNKNASYFYALNCRLHKGGQINTLLFKKVNTKRISFAFSCFVSPFSSFILVMIKEQRKLLKTHLTLLVFY